MNRAAAAVVAVLAAAVVLVVAVIAAVASYWHARAFAAAHAPNSVDGAPDMSPWLPLTTDGMVIAALLVIWTRRLTGQKTGAVPYGVLALGLVATVGANLASAGTGPGGWLVAAWAPVTFAVCDVCVALLAGPVRSALTRTATQTDQQIAPVPAPPVTVAEAVRQAETVDRSAEEAAPVRALTAVRSDRDEYLDDLVRWAAREGVPSSNAVIGRYKVGRTRAGKLLRQLAEAV